MMARMSGAVALMAAAVSAAAQPVPGRSDFVYVSDLASDGFTPFAASGAGALFGMKREAEMYLCFSLDTETDAAMRREVLSAELQGGAGDRSLPNIPVVCVLMQ